MPMSSIADLQTIYGGWNPEAYNQGRTQVGLEQQYQQELNRNQQLAGDKASLSNLYDSRTLDDRVRQPGLANTRTEQDILSNDYTLRGKKRTDQRESAMQQYNLDADQRKALMSITEDELKQGELQANQMLRSLDPNQQRDGQRILDTLGPVRAAKAKVEADMALHKFTEGEATKRSAATNATSLSVARINQEGQNNRAALKSNAKGGISSVYDAVKSGKVSPDKALAAFTAAALQARVQGDTEAAAEYENAANMMQQAVGITKSDPLAGKPDMAALGVATNAPKPDLFPNRAAKGPVGPAVGTVKGGYTFMGGDPAKPESWKKQ